MKIQEHKTDDRVDFHKLDYGDVFDGMYMKARSWNSEKGNFVDCFVDLYNGTVYHQLEDALYRVFHNPNALLVLEPENEA